MSWNYRVCKKGEVYAIHEAYYNNNGKVWAVTENPKSILTELCEFGYENEKDCLFGLQEQLEMMRMALTKPVLDLDTIIFASNNEEDELDREEYAKGCQEDLLD